MEITLTALGVLLAFVIGGWLLRLLVRMLGTRLLPQRMDALNVMGAIAFWGMVVVGLTLTVRLLAAPAVQDALATAARNSPALIAAVAVLVLGHLLGVALRDLLARSVRRACSGSSFQASSGDRLDCRMNVPPSTSPRNGFVWPNTR